MSHYIEKCRACGTVMGQCRCMSKDKTVRLSLCGRCKAARAETLRTAAAVDDAVASARLIHDLGKHRPTREPSPSELVVIRKEAG
jgi:hypothetical protein